MAIPVIDERIKHIGPGTVRKMDALKLRALRDLLVIQVNDEPLAVLVPYDMYLEMQKEVSEKEAAIAAKTAEFQREFRKLKGINYNEQSNGGVDQNPDMEYSKDSYRVETTELNVDPRCDHCDQPGAALCPSCFVAGHRAVANCQMCAEKGV